MIVTFAKYPDGWWVRATNVRKLGEPEGDIGMTIGFGKTKKEALESATDNLAKAYADVVELSEGKKKKK